MNKQPSIEQRQALSQAEQRAAASWNLSGGIRRHGPAFAAFADAVGHVALIRDPDLFLRSMVGTWPSFEQFVEDYVRESGLEESLDALPAQVRPLAMIDRAKVAVELQRELLVVMPGEGTGVWVFDAPTVVNSTVDETQR